MAPFIPQDTFGPTRTEIILTKYRSFKRRRKGTEEERILAFVNELMSDETVMSKVVTDARREGREAGFVEAVGTMGVLLNDGERPTDVAGAKLAMSEVSNQIAEFLPLRWKPVSELPSEGVFIGWNEGCDFFYVGHHDGERRCYSLDALINGSNFVRVHPTHFMPMPKPPGGAWDESVESTDLSGMTWLIDALEPFSQMAGLIRRFHGKTNMQEVQLTPLLNLFVADFERAEVALERLREVIGTRTGNSI
ncbi:hypothetical protein G6L37_03255 [Agrobacterium rubi]|nr:hypothetical protein [Agrobacterium rubi]NTF24393.1 hypothetical protein [Agrobacterium rubi]